ncbi:hypothetical protein [Legionella londiniensis]|uniref:Uncharacterized protein n=1 Tax=Legionella londiniensis TaxID=45068 RepID=A0A0W0VNR8_9GAMM|nr:hypothetical protein [Legionella londiniensis]KTD21688.1 hypothetical protein Llon_0853 [Legionella londiniensis]STX93477.1 Uncharacterised protein [Legionella londiniensis]
MYSLDALKSAIQQVVESGTPGEKDPAWFFGQKTLKTSLLRLKAISGFQSFCLNIQTADGLPGAIRFKPLVKFISFYLCLICLGGIGDKTFAAKYQPGVTHPSNHQASNEDIIKKMTAFLWLAENDKNKKQWATAAGEMLFHRYSYIPELQPMYARLTRHLDWLLLTNIMQSPGVRFLPEDGWLPEAPSLRIRRAITPQLKQAEHVLAGTGRLVYVMDFKKNQNIQMALKVIDVPFIPRTRVDIRYRLDNEPPVKLSIPADTVDKTIPISVAPGKHALRIDILNPVYNQYLAVSFKINGIKPELKRREQLYFVARQSEPIQLKIKGPVLLRIDERQKDIIMTRYQLVGSKIETIELKPSLGEQEALFRIFQRIPAEEIRQSMPRKINVPYIPAKDAFTQIDAPPKPKIVRFHDGLPLGGQENGTLSFAVSYNRRKDVLEREVTSIDLEQFEALNMNYRYYNQNLNTYFNTGIEQHIRRFGGAVLGIEERINYRPVWLPVNFWLYGNAFFQNPDGNQWIPLEGKQEWSTTWVGAVSQQRNFTPKTYHIPNASFLVRGMSLNNPEQYDPRDIDQNVFTSYTSNHREILELSDTVYHRPWLDALGFFRGTVANNEKMNLLSTKFDLGWRQLIGPVQADVSYQYANYYPEKLLRRTYSFNVLWQKWLNSMQLYELKFQIQRDIDAPATMGFLVFTWYTSNGRGYRDFVPNELFFRDIRSRNIPPCPNNGVIVK